MAADLLMFGLEITAAATAALLIVLLFRRPLLALFGARAAYCLWLLVPAALVAVCLPRAVLPPAPAAATVVAQAATLAPAPTEAAPAAPFELQRPDFVKEPGRLAGPLLILWLLGAAVHAGVLVHGQRRFLRGLGPLRAEDRTEGRVFHAASPHVGPALVGALRPRVILPADFAERFSAEEQAVVVAHERVHLTGGDAQINLLAAVFRALFWFHPLVPLAARMFREDQELACDEAVVARRPGLRRLYAEAMLKTQFAGALVPLGCHWFSGGKAGLRRRILRLKRTPGRGRRLAGAAAAALVALGGGAAAWAMQPPVEVETAGPTSEISAPTRRLLDAIDAGRNTEAAALLDAGADVNGWTRADGSPLILAVREGQLDLARLLLDRGADPNLVVPGEGAPLIMAADRGDQAMAELLLEHQADPNIAVLGDGNPLIAAAGGGHVQMVDLLLASGARIDAVVRNDETALITAVRFGHLPVVQRLIQHGADVNLAVMAPRASPLPPELRSPLGMARRAGRTDIVDYLRAHGARA